MNKAGFSQKNTNAGPKIREYYNAMRLSWASAQGSRIYFHVLENKQVLEEILRMRSKESRNFLRSGPFFSFFRFFLLCADFFSSKCATSQRFLPPKKVNPGVCCASRLAACCTSRFWGHFIGDSQEQVDKYEPNG
jgi:hypothetical protein